MSESVRIRASSWGLLFDCAYAWEGIHLMGMRKPLSGRAFLGTSMHRSTATIDTRQMQDNPMSTEEATDYFMEILKNPDEEVDWKRDDLAMNEASVIGTVLTLNYLQEWSPGFDFLSVEKEIGSLEIITEDSVVIELTGRMDRSRVVKSPEKQKSIIDIKTGKAAVQKGRAKTKGHAAQLGVYEILEEEESGEACTGPAGILGMQTSSRPKIALGSIENPRHLLLGDESNEGLISMAGKMLKTGLFPPNPSSILCDQRYCPRWDKCIYHD